MDFSSILNDRHKRNPTSYAQKILQECDLKEPPIDEKVILNHLGIDLNEFTREQIRAFERNNPESHELSPALSTACAWLQREPDGRSCIWVNRNMAEERTRLSIFHECGHAILPWHQDIDFSDLETDSQVQKIIEQEAFDCAFEFLMPKEIFLKDALALPIQMDSIEKLGKRYIASKEATAIRYAKLHQDKCAVLIMEDSSEPGLCFKVRNFVTSARFPSVFSAGDGIKKQGSFFDAWMAGEDFEGILSSSEFQLKKRLLKPMNFDAECISLATPSDLLVLISNPRPDNSES